MKKRIFLVLFCIFLIIVLIAFSNIDLCFLKQIFINKKSRQPSIHFSVDDTFEVFKDLTENKNIYNSLFDNPFLSFLYQLNEKYGIKVTLYCFYESESFCLSDMTDKYKSEFLSNLDWLKFGLHARNSSEDLGFCSFSDYNSCYTDFESEISRFAGGKKQIDSFVRLSYFKGSQDLIDGFIKSKIVTGLYTADDERVSYCLKGYETNFLKNHDIYFNNGITYIHTDFRVENYTNETIEISSNNQIIEFFTHECEFENEVVLHKIEELCDYANKNNLLWKYGSELEQ